MKNKLFIVAPILAISTLLAVSLSNTNLLKETKAATKYETDCETYYQGTVTESMYGTTLLDAIHDLSASTHQTYVTYADLKQDLVITDEDPDIPGNIIYLYAQKSYDGTWNSSNYNREHVWCQSLSNGMWNNDGEKTIGGGSDLHHLRPANSNINSMRNNTPYAEGIKGTSSATKVDITDNYYNGTSFEPADYIKGDIARIILYTYMHYDGTYGEITHGGKTLTGTLPINNIVNVGAAPTEQKAFDLLTKWSTQDPISYNEILRNRKASEIQGNRNPFIDHPEYANVIWGEKKGLTISTSDAKIAINETKKISAKAIGNYTNCGIISYSIDDTSVASVDSEGNVKGIKNGLVKLTAKAEIDGKEFTTISYVSVGTGYQPKGETIKGAKYTIISKTELKASQKISGVETTFNQTGSNVCQLTGGDSLTLEIKNFPYRITGIEMNMHSNKANGSGKVEIKINDKAYTTKEGFYNAKDFGKRYTVYYEYLDMTNKSFTPEAGNIKITVNATRPSLFLEDVIVQYDSSTPDQYLETFVNTIDPLYKASGNTASEELKQAWKTEFDLYSGLETTLQNEYKNTEPKENGTDKEKLVYCYKKVLDKYSPEPFTNFGGDYLNKYVAPANNSNLGLILGLSIGGGVIVITGIVLGLYLYKRNKKTQQ